MTFDIRKLNVGDFLWVAREKVTPVPGKHTYTCLLCILNLPIVFYLDAINDQQVAVLLLLEEIYTITVNVIWFV